MNAVAPLFGCATDGMKFGDPLERVLRLVDTPLPTEEILLAECVGRVKPPHGQ